MKIRFYLNENSVPISITSLSSAAVLICSMRGIDLANFLSTKKHLSNENVKVNRRLQLDESSDLFPFEAYKVENRGKI
jgi:hypothetical protein